ncbi:MAG TPA: aminotransferase class V-fold PLP-dependent enzyme, partial [Thermopolyspora sp.]
MAYFDAASSEPLHPDARAALLAALDTGWADPARLYGVARQADLLLERARSDVAEVLGVRPDELSFTSSGTQAVHLGVLGAALARRRVGRELVVGAVEHSSVLQTGQVHERDGGTVRVVGVSRTGRVNVPEFAEAV